jgi:uncharacterized protein YbdZ (MbtH family)
MSNPFEDESRDYLVLVNREGQYSLWPDFREIPAGWTPVGQRGKRRDCLHWIESNWVDMCPRNLAEEMGKAISRGRDKIR